MIHFFLMINKQGTTRIRKFYNEALARQQIERDVFQTMVSRDKVLSNVCEVRDYTVVYHRYVGLYVAVGIDPTDSELLAHETIHLFVEILDRYFGTVRELDVIYHFHAVYAILDEFILAGEVQETNKQMIIQRIKQMPQLAAK
ncbi:hypothetical protein CTAYLR_002670 [Chrysophaeum taylorii]|uniref:AP complex subunit sigma n=1 Tax=Chrysophaeum taylorii TaxID=2483200 RepID=A0AAD7XN12_9STRA|nr:hypothetical protein CTAYLR_002670 [Chrysophaeum taylorii]